MNKKVRSIALLFVFVVLVGVAGFIGYQIYQANLAPETSKAASGTDMGDPPNDKGFTNINANGNCSVDGSTGSCSVGGDIKSVYKFFCWWDTGDSKIECGGGGGAPYKEEFTNTDGSNKDVAAGCGQLIQVDSFTASSCRSGGDWTCGNASGHLVYYTGKCNCNDKCGSDVVCPSDNKCVDVNGKNRCIPTTCLNASGGFDSTKCSATSPCTPPSPTVPKCDDYCTGNGSGDHQCPTASGTQCYPSTCIGDACNSRKCVLTSCLTGGILDPAKCTGACTPIVVGKCGDTCTADSQCPSNDKCLADSAGTKKCTLVTTASVSGCTTGGAYDPSKCPNDRCTPVAKLACGENCNAQTQCASNNPCVPSTNGGTDTKCTLPACVTNGIYNPVNCPNGNRCTPIIITDVTCGQTCNSTNLKCPDNNTCTAIAGQGSKCVLTNPCLLNGAVDTTKCSDMCTPIAPTLTVNKTSAEVCTTGMIHNVTYTVTLNNPTNAAIQYSSIVDTLTGIADPTLVISSNPAAVVTPGAPPGGVAALNITWPGGSIAAHTTLTFTYVVRLTDTQAKAVPNQTLNNTVIASYGTTNTQFTNSQSLFCELPHTGLKEDLMWVVAILFMGTAVIAYKKRFQVDWVEGKLRSAGGIGEFLADKLQSAVDHSPIMERPGKKTLERRLMQEEKNK